MRIQLCPSRCALGIHPMNHSFGCVGQTGRERERHDRCHVWNHPLPEWVKGMARRPLNVKRILHRSVCMGVEQSTHLSKMEKGRIVQKKKINRPGFPKIFFNGPGKVGGDFRKKKSEEIYLVTFPKKSFILLLVPKRLAYKNLFFFRGYESGKCRILESR